MADRFHRRYVIAIGVISWGLTTICLSFASNFWAIVVLRGINGFFLGSVGPISQSVLADIAPQHSRGYQFGLVQMSQCGGRIIGGVVTTSVAFSQLAGISVSHEKQQQQALLF